MFQKLGSLMGFGSTPQSNNTSQTANEQDRAVADNEFTQQISSEQQQHSASKQPQQQQDYKTPNKSRAPQRRPSSRSSNNKSNSRPATPPTVTAQQATLDWSHATVQCSAAISISMQDAEGALTLRAPHAMLEMLQRPASFNYAFRCMNQGKMVLLAPVVEELPVYIDSRAHSLILMPTVGEQVVAFHLKFEDPQQQAEMSQAYQIACFEQARQQDYNKLIKANDKLLYQHTLNQDTEMIDAATTNESSQSQFEDEMMDWQESRPAKNEDEWRRQSAALSPENSQQRDAESESEEEEEVQNHTRASARKAPDTKQRSAVKFSRASAHKGRAAGNANDHLATGQAVNRTFVSRGAQLGVFKHDAEGELEYLSRLPVVTSMSGQAFEPGQLMLHQNDDKMMMLDKNDANTVYEMDLERGQVIQEFGAGSDGGMAIRSLGHVNKYAERSGEQTMLAVNNNSIFSLDPRLAGRNKVAQLQQMAKPADFSSVSTTGSGFAAVASHKGEIRLYNDIEKRAKTLFPGLGDAISFIDTTEAGDYVLATCATYLLLIPTQSADEKKSGFTASVSASQRPPIKLQLSPKDMLKFNIRRVAFTAAKFNTAWNAKERFIVTSTGAFVCSWNLADVLRGHKNRYSIKKSTASVIASDTLFGQDSIVIAQKQNIYVDVRKGKQNK